MTACVIGVGNDLRGDDGAGLLVARKLARTCSPNVRVVECEGEPVSMLDLWGDCETAIVVDTTQSGAAPGTIRRIAAHAGPLPPGLAGTSTHLLGVADAIELARALGRLPSTTIVYGIEGGTFETGAGVSEVVESAVERVAAAIARELESDD
jgi:hydrogenase maturation protease